MKSILIILLLALPSLALANKVDPVKQGMIQHLRSIGTVYATAYAPAEWKNKHSGWDLEAEIQKAMTKVNQRGDITIKDYHVILKDFFNSMNDYHVGFGFEQTESSRLPITVKSHNGTYYIVHIDREKISEELFPAQIGDQLVLFNGKPVQTEIDALIKETGQGVAQTDQAMAEIFLFNRFAATAMKVLKGSAELRVKHRLTKKERTYQLSWDYTPEKIQLQPGPAQVHGIPFPNKKPIRDLVREMTLTLPTWHLLVADEKDDNKEEVKKAPNPYQVGAKKSFVPELGTIVWQQPKDKLFHAYVYKEKGGKLLGYVRIPHYMGTSAHFKELKEIIKKFESTTEGLVIDQVNNPGGSLFYIYAMMSILNPDLTVTPREHIKIDPSWVKNADSILSSLRDIKNDAEAQKTLGKDWDGYPIGYQTVLFLRDFAQTILSEWKAGKTLTAPTHVWGVDYVNPNKDVAYSKPIIVLANELDFSGGDFFPAILQDNKRAKIMGVRTAGAGGFVRGTATPNPYGLRFFTFTGSLAKRVNNQPIENLGVTPDIDYVITGKDYTEKFVDYKKAINKALLDQM